MEFFPIRNRFSMAGFQASELSTLTVKQAVQESNDAWEYMRKAVVNMMDAQGYFSEEVFFNNQNLCANRLQDAMDLSTQETKDLLRGWLQNIRANTNGIAEFDLSRITPGKYAEIIINQNSALDIDNQTDPASPCAIETKKIKIGGYDYTLARKTMIDETGAERAVYTVNIAASDGSQAWTDGSGRNGVTYAGKESYDAWMGKVKTQR